MFLTPNIHIILNQLTDWLFPKRCPVCQDIIMPKGHLICPGCFLKLSYVNRSACKKCGKELSDNTNEYCMDCKNHKRSFEYGMALINYDDIASRSMVQMKYKHKKEYLEFYGYAIAKRYKARLLNIKADCFVPVPIHASRKRKRGYNQAQILAEHISLYTGIPVYTDILIRNKKTVPQKKLSPKERLANLEQAFQAGEIPEFVKSVILVDDIYTTGSTIEACTRVLKKCGVRYVYFVTICIGSPE